MNETLEAYNKRRAVARRAYLGDESTRATNASREKSAAFNAGFDAGAQPKLYPAGYEPGRPNHYYHDAAGDPAACTANHNHPEGD